MAHYYQLGKIPPKRHTVFRKDDGSLYHEELISTEGFSSNYSLVYHCNPPTKVTQIETPWTVAPEAAIEKNMQHRSFEGFKVVPHNDYLKSRTPVLFNSDVCISLAVPRQSTSTYFFKNSDAHEMLFVHEGSGKLFTIFGELPFKSGDHIIIPRAITYQIYFDTTENRLFILESFSPFRYPRRYTNSDGQLLEHSPFCERDIRKPGNLQTHTGKNDYKVLIKKNDMIYPYHYQHHPFDAIGWDGFHYPYIFSIHDFEPITGRLHQPPPVHQTFEGRNFVTCAFVPRLYDYHPDSIPAPYHHSNVDSDEVLYYVDGDFMSRNNIGKGQITLHPIGIPHGPHPGAIERSIGAKATEEIAVMVDTFRPLKITRQALDIEVEDYYKSWLD